MVMNFDLARRNMVEQQVRTWEVLEPRVLEVLGAIHREDFVPSRYRKMAYADTALPLDNGQFMMKPVVEGRLLQALDVRPDDEVLEIGTGSGYLTACLATLGRHVTSVDCHEKFTETAAGKLKSAGLENVKLETGDALGYWDPGKSFSVVAVTGSAQQIPDRFRNWLAPGGRLFMVTGASPAMEAHLLQRMDETNWTSESLFETDLGRLVGAEDRPRFEF